MEAIVVESRSPDLWVRGPSEPRAPQSRAVEEHQREAPPQPASREADIGGQRQRMPAPAASRRPPRSAGRTHGSVGWLSVHGGAGATTLTRLLGGVDIGSRWPRGDDPRAVYLVARTHAAGLRATSQMLNVLKHGENAPDLRVLGVVLVPDAPGRLPVQLQRRIRVLRSVADVHRLSWISSLRTDELPRELPKELQKLAARTSARKGGLVE